MDRTLTEPLAQRDTLSDDRRDDDPRYDDRRPDDRRSDLDRPHGPRRRRGGFLGELIEGFSD